MIVDTFPINNELDMLEMRLETMADAVDYFIAVEADVDHQDHPKPFHITDNLDRFEKWADKLIVVKATGMPTHDDDPDPWARELAQREYVLDGIRDIPGVDEDTIVLHGDVDEICRPLYVRNVRPKFPKKVARFLEEGGSLRALLDADGKWDRDLVRIYFNDSDLLVDGSPNLGFVSFDQRLHCFAVDWLHPDPWGGTVAGTPEQILQLGANPFQKMRNLRNWNVTSLPDSGWHFSWLGGREAALAKLNSFCHPEVAERTLVGIESDQFLREGFHLDGRRMAPVEVDDTWPAYIFERRCPTEWFRPR